MYRFPCFRCRACGKSFSTQTFSLDYYAKRVIAYDDLLKRHVGSESNENVCIDGFVSFDQSQYFPNEIVARSKDGVRTPCRQAHLLGHPGYSRQQSYSTPLPRRSQDEEHRIAHITITSTLPRTYANPLFASNYLDREIRKDQANHRRETTCFCRNVAKGMLRLVLYLIDHNYRKRFSIKARSSDTRVHAQIAGIDKAPIALELRKMFSERAFISNLTLPQTLDRIWRKRFTTPLTHSPEYLPAFTLA
jgi:hypothetical protein